VFVNEDRSVGWSFDRQSCMGSQNPDFPAIEFGIHPFDPAGSLAQTPSYSSTTLLPMQMKDLNAIVTIENLAISLSEAGSWTLGLRFWLSEFNPLSGGDPGVQLQFDVLWGWQAGRTPCTQPASEVQVSEGKSYLPCLHETMWGPGNWEHWEFRLQSGPATTFDGAVDLDTFFGYAEGKGASNTWWVTRIELGTAIDDQTVGEVTLDDITFSMNGLSRSIELAD